MPEEEAPTGKAIEEGEGEPQELGDTRAVSDISTSEAIRVAEEQGTESAFAAYTVAGDAVISDRRQFTFVGLDTSQAAALARGRPALAAGKPSLPANRIPDDLRHKLRAVHVATAAYKLAKQVLRKERLVVLWGPPNTGKRAAAVHLGDGMVSERGRIFELSPNVHLSQLAPQTLPCKGAGYVVERLAADEATKLSGFAARGLAQRLAEADSYLVLCVDQAVGLSAEDLSPYVVHWKERPDAAAVLDRHLQFYAGSDREALAKARELGQQGEVVDALNKDPTPSDLDALAQSLLAVSRGEYALNAVLGSLRSRLEAQVEKWFDDHDDLDLHVQMVAQGALDGAAYSEIRQAARNLRERLEPGDREAQEGEAPLSPFSPRRKASLDALQVKPEIEYRQAEYGQTQVKVIRFRNPAYRRVVLPYIWEHYHDLREPLLDWLAECGETGSADLCWRTANAASLLATAEFEPVLRDVLSRWARSPDARPRVAVGVALGDLVWDAEHTSEVLGLLNHWSTLDNFRLRWTAAAAYGAVGLRYPDEALAGLKGLAECEWVGLLSPIKRSIRVLFGAGHSSPEFQARILSELATWVSDKRYGVQLAAKLAFLDLAQVTAAETDDDDAGRAAVPAVLQLAKSAVPRDSIVAMLRGILNEKGTRSMGLDLLQRWLRKVADYPELAEGIADVLSPIYSGKSARERDRIVHWLTKWGSRERDAIGGARKVMSLLGLQEGE